MTLALAHYVLPLSISGTDEGKPMSENHLLRALGMAAICACFTALPSAAQADVFSMPSGQTSMQFVTVGDPGNAPDTTGYGAVGYAYQMGQYDVTVAQYTQFLNAVAATDTYGLYNSLMATDYPGWSIRFGIARSGSPGSYTYSVIGNGDGPLRDAATGNANVPVFDETWGDAARFSNWLQNGQPTGAQGPGTTETGAYTLNGATTTDALQAVTRNAGATYVIPSEDEWYKAAYYKGGGTNAAYWAYATQSNTVPSNVLSASGTNNANYDNNGSRTDPVNFLTPVGAFASSPSAYGTYDQAGNVWNWTEGIFNGPTRAQRGGSWDDGPDVMAASGRGNGNPAGEFDYGFISGFRVAHVGIGDMNGDGVVDNFDVAAFELALTDPAAYLALYPTLTNYAQHGDVNGDGQFNNFDAAAFEQLFTVGQTVVVPEPGSFMLLALGAIGLLICARRRNA